MMTELSTAIRKLSTNLSTKKLVGKVKISRTRLSLRGNLRLDGKVTENLTPLDRRGYHKQNTHTFLLGVKS